MILLKKERNDATAVNSCNLTDKKARLHCSES